MTNIKLVRRFFTKKIFIISVVLALVVGIAFYFAFRGGEEEYDFVIVERGDVIQEVSVTGKVEAQESVELGFEMNGRVQTVGVEVGEIVNAGDILVILKNSDLGTEREDVRANMEAEKAKLAELKRGARQEDIDIKQAELSAEEQDLINYYKDAVYELSDAYTVADNAVRTKTSSMFSGSVLSFFELTFDPCDSGAESQVSFMRLRVENALSDWDAELQSVSSFSRSELDDVLVSDRAYLSLIKNFLKDASAVLSTGCAASNSTYDTYRTNVSVARTNIDTAISDLSNLEQSIAVEVAAVDKAQKELDKLLAGASQEKIDEQEARVDQAFAKVGNVTARLVKTILRSPIAGTVTKQDAEIGEIVTANQKLVTVQSVSQFKIKTNIPEVDIVKVSIGDVALITLDAFGSDREFSATVTEIDPAETVIEGVSTYKTTLQFSEEYEGIKSGMTADVEILTEKAENVIAISQRAVIRTNGEKFVRIVRNGNIENVTVITGIRGSEGEIEIKSGVSEGDKVVTFLK